MPKACDACQVAAALVYCKADAAFLCANCDGKVHGANKLASRHERVWMCEVCEMAPAAITCKADAAALCPACDRDIHSANPLARRHERVPITPFVECPSMIKVAHIQSAVNGPTFLPDTSGLLRGGLFDGLRGLTDNVDAEVEGNVGEEEDADDETTAAEAASWILPRPAGLQHRPSVSSASDPLSRSPVVPSLSLGMATLGMFPSPFQQLPHRSLSDSGMIPGLPNPFAASLTKSGFVGFAGPAKVEPIGSNQDVLFDIDPFLDFEKFSHQGAGQGPLGFQGIPKNSMVPVHSDGTHASPSLSNASSLETIMRKQFAFPTVETKVPSLLDPGVVPDGQEFPSLVQPDGLTAPLKFDQLPSSTRLLQLSQLQPMAREAKVLRYREKKKSRKFEKTIRYASRKAYAESRPRIKGRFAKRGDTAGMSASPDDESNCFTEDSVGIFTDFQ